jgi:ankyrin repeat protein
MKRLLIFIIGLSFFYNGINFAMEPASPSVPGPADDFKRELSEHLLEASKTGTLSAVDELIGAQADVNYARPADGYTPLMLAAMFLDREEVCNLLIKHGADIRVRNKFGRTAFQIAAFNFQLELCDIIFEKALRIFDEKQKERMCVFLFCLRQKHSVDYSNLKNIFKKEIITFFIEENRIKVLAEIGKLNDYAGYFHARYSSLFKTHVE